MATNPYQCPHCYTHKTEECHSWTKYPKAFIRRYCRKCDKRYIVEFELIDPKKIMKGEEATEEASKYLNEYYKDEPRWWETDKLMQWGARGLGFVAGFKKAKLLYGPKK